MQTVIFQGSYDSMLLFYQVNVLLHKTLIRQQFILGKPLGEENPAELLYYRFNQVQCQDDLHQEE